MKNLLKQNVYVESNWLSAQWQILGMSPHSIASYSYHPPNDRYEECSFLLWGE